MLDPVSIGGRVFFDNDSTFFKNFFFDISLIMNLLSMKIKKLILQLNGMICLQKKSLFL